MNVEGTPSSSSESEDSAPWFVVSGAWSGLPVAIAEHREPEAPDTTTPENVLTDYIEVDVQLEPFRAA